MKGKNLLILVVLALILAGLAVVTSRRSQNAPPDLVGKSVLPDLPVNDIAQLVVRSGPETSIVEKVGGTWLSRSRYGYPADFSKVKDTILKLAELKIGQVVKADDALRAKLKMVPPSDSDESSTMIELRGAQGDILASLLLGATRQRAPDEQQAAFGPYPVGHYVSPDNGQAVCLVAEVLDTIKATPIDWIDSDLVNIPSSDTIAGVNISGPEREDVRLSAENGTFSLPGLQDDEEIDSAKISQIKSALSYLRLNDIADPALPDQKLGMDKPVVFEVITTKREVYTVHVGGSPEDSTDRYVRLTVALLPTEEPAKTPDGATDDEADEATGEDEARRKKERAELEQTTDKLREKTRGWTYLIASYTAESMTATRDELVKKKDKKDEDDVNVEPPPPPEEPVEDGPEPVPEGEPIPAQDPDYPI